MSTESKHEDKSGDRAEEVRVLEVRRTIKVVKQDVKSESFVFHLVAGEWKFHTSGAYDFDVEDLEMALEQLKILKKENPDKPEEE